MARTARKSIDPKSPSETAFHMAVAKLLRAVLPPSIIFFHCPNGELRDARTAGKLKSMGVLPGVPDIGLLLPRGRMGWIELKVGNGQLSGDQIAFRDRAISLGHGHEVCRSLADVERTVARWLAAFNLTLRGRISA